MRVLEPLVRDMLKIDSDVMIVGDFNVHPEEARSLAERLGMSVLLGKNQAAVGTLSSGNRYDYFFVSPDLAAEEAQGATVVVFDRADREPETSPERQRAGRAASGPPAVLTEQWHTCRPPHATAIGDYGALLLGLARLQNSARSIRVRIPLICPAPRTRTPVQPDISRR